MRQLRGKIGGHISTAVRLEGKAYVLAKEGKIEEAAQLRKEATNHRRIASELRTQYYNAQS